MLARASIATRAMAGFSQYGTADRKESTSSRNPRSATGSAASTANGWAISQPARALTRAAARLAAARSTSAILTRAASPKRAMSYAAAVPCRPAPTTA